MIYPYVSFKSHFPGSQEYVEVSVAASAYFLGGSKFVVSQVKLSLRRSPFAPNAVSMRSRGSVSSVGVYWRADSLFPIADPVCWQVLPHMAAVSRLPWDNLHLAPSLLSFIPFEGRFHILL